MSNELSARDYEVIVGILYQISVPQDILSFRDELLTRIRMIIPCNQAEFCTLDVVDGIAYMDEPFFMGKPANFVNEFMDGYDRDPYFMGFYLKPSTAVFRDTDMMTDEQRHAAKVYQDIYKKQGVEYIMRAVLAYDGKPFAEITLFNTPEQGDFTAREKDILEHIAPQAALRLHQVLHREAALEPAEDESTASMLVQRYDLTARECEIVGLAAQGLSDRAIADELVISISTVRKHVYNAYRKMDINSRFQLRELLK